MDEALEMHSFEFYEFLITSSFEFEFPVIKVIRGIGKPFRRSRRAFARSFQIWKSVMTISPSRSAGVPDPTELLVLRPVAASRKPSAKTS